MRKFIGAILFLFCMFADNAGAQVNKQYFVWVGRDMVMDSRYREAIETLNILLRADPDAYEGYFWRGIAKYHLDDLLGAERDFTLTLAKNPVYTNAYQFRALTRSRLGNYDDAMKDFDEAIELRPDYPAPYYSRGVTNILTGRYREAVDDFNMYMRFNQRDADAYANRGTAYLHLQDTVAAYEDFGRAIRTNREYPRGYLERGSLYMEQGRYDEALADFDTAVRCDTSYIPAYFSRAMAYYRKHNLQAALADFDRVLELDPTSSVTYFNRALVRTETGDYNRALEDYDQVAAYSPGNVIVYYNRAGLRFRLGELQGALEDYDRAIELYPDFANAYLGRASVKYLLRDSEGAERDRSVAERKIAEYRARLEGESEVSFADTSRQFDKLLSFDTQLSDGPVRNTATGTKERITLRPSYGFTLRSDAEPGRGLILHPGEAEAEEFIASLGDASVVFGCEGSDMAAAALVRKDEAVSADIAANGSRWQAYFMRGMTQALLKQYTNAVGALSTAITLSAQPVPLHRPQRRTGRNDGFHLLHGQRLFAHFARKRPFGQDARRGTDVRLRRSHLRPEQGGQTQSEPPLHLLQPGQSVRPVGTLPGGIRGVFARHRPRPGPRRSLFQQGLGTDIHEGYPQGAARHQQGGRTRHRRSLRPAPALLGRRHAERHGQLT